VWTERQQHEWERVFGGQQSPWTLPRERPSYDARRRVVEAARRAFYTVARLRGEFLGKRGVTYSLASTAVRGW
jgi:hypothetical protein